MVLIFSELERQLVESNDLCRIATISPDGFPHLVPVSYLFLKGFFHIPASRASKKVRNIRKNNKTALLIDDETSQAGIMIECLAEITPGRDILRMMRETKSWTNEPDQSIIIKATPIEKTSWFLKLPTTDKG